MIEVETIMFDEKEYMIIKRKKVDDDTYVLISNIEDPNDYTIRKEIIENGEEVVVGLSSEEEFDKVIPYFIDSEEKN